MKTATMIQVNLKADDGTQMTTWVEKRPDIKVGNKIQLDKQDKWYVIKEVYNHEITKDKLELNRGWTNNI
jgi:hypothetical protein